MVQIENAIKNMSRRFKAGHTDDIWAPLNIFCKSKKVR